MLRYKMKTLLIVDDDKAFCEAVKYHFMTKNWQTLVAHKGAEAVKLCSVQKVDVVLLDQKLPDGQGVGFCSSILSRNDQTKIIFSTAYPNFENAVEAIRMGAYDYLSKPFKLEMLELAIQKAFRTVELEKVSQVQSYKKQKESEEAVLVGGASGMGDVRKLIELAASSEAPVLITGETGTGKSLVAKCIHYRGGRCTEAFISPNCASFPENLIEAELFGCEKGAFTGAVAARKGVFEMAENGTLFLDEIGELPIHLQSKLLGVLDDRQIKRVGGETIRPVDARIIAATNRDLEEAVAEKSFRNDLYYRLSVLRIHVPPLRERVDDIPDLCRFFIENIAPSMPFRLPDGEIRQLMNYPWPGNVRELRNIIERAIILRQGDRLEPSRLLANGGAAAGGIDQPVADKENGFSPLSPTGDLASLRHVEEQYIRFALGQLANNYTATARALGISRSTLMRKVKTFNPEVSS